jgi:hypothetical protein
MAVQIITDLPGVTAEMYQEVGRQMMKIDPNPIPKGLMLHIASESKAGLKVVDIWETREDWEHFDQNLLMPSIMAAGLTTQTTPISEEFTVLFMEKL